MSLERISLLALVSMLFPAGIAHPQTPLGDDLVIGAFPPDVQLESFPQATYDDVACGPDGEFLVVWSRAPAPDTTKDILARRYSAKGLPLGAPFRVNNERLLDQRFPMVTADAQGNYFVAWQGFDPGSPDYQWDIHGRLFRHDGTPVSSEIRLNQEQQFDQVVPRVASGLEWDVHSRLAEFEPSADGQWRSCSSDSAV